MPWTKNVFITSLPEGIKKIEYLQSLITNAVQHGAQLINNDYFTNTNNNNINNNDNDNLNSCGGSVYGLLMKPAILYPVNTNMKIFHEEQFGPIIPITTYKSIHEIYEYLKTTSYGQQAAIFSKNSTTISNILDILSTVVGRININTQCGRSPDTLPFSGRR